MNGLGRTCMLALVTACGPGAVEPATQVIVLVGGDLNVATLEVSVTTEDGKERIDGRTYDLTRIQPMRLPTSFTILARPHAKDARFRVNVRGQARASDGSTRPLARTSVIAAFVPERALLLPILLSESCATERCNCEAEDTCERVCDPLPYPRCVAIPRYPAGGLAEIEPGTELDVLDEGLFGCERGALPGPDGSCRDVDECAFVIDACQLEPRACVNLMPAEGRYECACPEGYAGAGVADDPCVVCSDGDCTNVMTEDDWL